MEHGLPWRCLGARLTKREFYEACDFAMVHGKVPRDLLPSFDGLQRGGIVGRWTITDVMRPGGMTGFRVYPGTGAAFAAHARKGDRWHMPAQFGIIVENARAVPFVECSGALGFWRVPEPILTELARSA